MHINVALLAFLHLIDRYLDNFSLQTYEGYARFHYCLLILEEQEFVNLAKHVGINSRENIVKLAYLEHLLVI